MPTVWRDEGGVTKLRAGGPLRVVVESPLSGDRERNKRYARLCTLDCLDRGEAPYASHALYDHADVLDDTKPDERKRGMEAGFAWGAVAELCVVYMDLGESAGMTMGIVRATANGIGVEYRRLPPHLFERLDAPTP